MEKVILQLKNSLDKSTLEDSERMLRSFYRTIEPHYKRNWKEPESISWEIYAEKDDIGFYVIAPKRLSRLIRSRITEAYPQVAITEIEKDYVSNFSNPYTARMDLHKHFMFATNLQASDTTLNSLLNSMSRLEEEERMLLQISLLPINDKWQGIAYRKYRELLFHGKKPNVLNSKSILLRGLIMSIKGLLMPLDIIMRSIMQLDSDEQKNTPIERQELKGTQTKISLPAFNTSIRLAVESPIKGAMGTRISELSNSFIETDGDNEWRRVIKINNKTIMDEIIARKVDRFTNNKVTTAELSPIVRLANRNIIVPELAIKMMKTLPIPKGLDQGVFLGKGLYNSQEIDVFNSPEHVDSFVHPWMVSGAMGGGKTTLINNMMLARVLQGYCGIILDTQGDMSRDFLAQLPESEHHRVVWLNFGDLDFPVALDMLETVSVKDPKHQKFVAQFAKNELVALFKRMFGQNFGPQTEYIVRHIITATMISGQSSFLEMFRMLVDDEFREEITSKIKFKAPFSWSFWRNFQDNFSLPQKMRMMMPSINKIGSFVENPVIMNITSQGLGSQNYSFREMMDEGKIVVVTIPKGKLLGTWQLIGSLILGKIWTAALSRENVPIEKRKPAFLAVDEAEDLIEGNDNFDIMLSQARKFRLGPIFGFQYLDQVKTANKRVYNALIGNKPNVVALKIGQKDAEVYEDLFKGYYSAQEMDFPDLHGIAKLNINGTYSTPFTLKVPYNFFTRDNEPRTLNESAVDMILDNSRKLYAKPIDEVERLVESKYSDIVTTLEIAEGFDEEQDAIEASEDLISQLRGIS